MSCMKPIQDGETITILRTANGWLVRRQIFPGDAVMEGDCLVFNEMGYASSAGDGKECLLTFIAKHFDKGST